MTWTSAQVSRVDDVLERIKFDKWKFRTAFAGAMYDALYLQIAADEVCNVTGKPMMWTSRKWLLSKHMTDGEIVQTAFKAVMTAMEHEVREKFLYRGVSVFDPHYDIEKLVELRSSPDAIKERPAA